MRKRNGTNREQATRSKLSSGRKWAKKNHQPKINKMRVYQKEMTWKSSQTEIIFENGSFDLVFPALSLATEKRSLWGNCCFWLYLFYRWIYNNKQKYVCVQIHSLHDDWWLCWAARAREPAKLLIHSRHFGVFEENYKRAKENYKPAIL